MVDRGWTFPAYAKLNLTLEILGVRADGCHELRSIMQTVDLADQLEIQPADRLRVTCSRPDLNSEANLVWRAAQALAERAGIEPRAHISIEKRIPVGMGFGGGSSDAAAALLALDRLWGLRLPEEELAEIAAGVGSDVPFFLHGGTALASGRGEILERLPALPRTSVVLVCPREPGFPTIPGKTAMMYGRVTPQQYSDDWMTGQMKQAILTGEPLRPFLYNCFEHVVFSVFNPLGPVYSAITAHRQESPHLTGSGPALFFFPREEAEEQRVAEALAEHPVETHLVHTV